jgi:TolB protein
VALVALAMPASAGASTFPGTNGRIVFAQSTGTGTTESIVTVNADGSGAKQLTSGHVDSDPRFSADGKRIVFDRYGFASSTSRLATHVMVMNSDGSGLTDLSAAETGTAFSDFSPSFSPDGTQIVFERYDMSTETPVGIYKIASTGSATAAPLTTGPDSRPTYSPDGTRIAFERQTDTGDAIYTASSTTVDGPVQQVVPDGADPDWSPDGKHIVFSGGFQSIAVANADGSGTPVTLVKDSGIVHDESPAYSPDGTRIVFASTRGTVGQAGPGGSQAYGLYTISPSGGNVAAVPGLGGSSTQSDMEPDWGVASVSQPPTPQPPPPATRCGSGKEPDRNGDLHSNCHTGSKGRGAGGNDKTTGGSSKKRRR